MKGLVVLPSLQVSLCIVLMNSLNRIDESHSMKLVTQFLFLVLLFRKLSPFVRKILAWGLSSLSDGHKKKYGCFSSVLFKLLFYKQGWFLTRVITGMKSGLYILLQTSECNEWNGITLIHQQNKKNPNTDLNSNIWILPSGTEKGTRCWLYALGVKINAFT